MFPILWNYPQNDELSYSALNMIQGDEFLRKIPWKADYNGVQMRHTTWVYWPLCSRRALRSSSRHDGLQMHGRLWTFSSANSGSHGTAELSRVGFTFMFLLNKLSQVWEEHGENGLLLQVYFSRQGMLESWTSTPSWNELALGPSWLASMAV